MSKHTPTPWKFDHEDVFAADGSVVIADRPNRHVTPVGHSEWEANAAYIVRAVNAHEGLVRALEMFLAEFGDEDVQKRTPIAYYKAVDAARAALSAAKE